MGFFKKIGDFFGNIWGGVKKVFNKVAPIAKTVLPFLAPIIPGGPATTAAISTGLNIGEKLLGNNSENSDATKKIMPEMNITNEPRFRSNMIRLRR